MPKVSDADLAYYAKFGGVSDIPDIARELIAARQVIEAVREYDLPPGLRRDPLGNGYVPVQHALREYDATTREG